MKESPFWNQYTKLQLENGTFFRAASNGYIGNIHKAFIPEGASGVEIAKTRATMQIAFEAGLAFMFTLLTKEIDAVKGRTPANMKRLAEQATESYGMVMHLHQNPARIDEILGQLAKKRQ